MIFAERKATAWNQGSLILKLAFELTEAQAAAKALQPIQQGVGVKRGMEVIAHVCNALYSEGYAFKNGRN